MLLVLGFESTRLSQEMTDDPRLIKLSISSFTTRSTLTQAVLS